MNTIQVLKDYGKGGKMASSVFMYANPLDKCDFNDSLNQKIASSWTSDSNQNKSNNINLNYRGIESVDSILSKDMRFQYSSSGSVLSSFSNVRLDDDVLTFGTSMFGQYDAKKKFNSNEEARKSFGVTEEEADMLYDNVRPFSIFPAVHTKGNEYLVMGKKGPNVSEEGQFKTSFPGAGYLVYKDTLQEDLHVKSTNQIINDKILNQLGIGEDHIEYNKILGIYEDVAKGSHMNPAMFSKTMTDLNPFEITSLYNYAPNASKHDSIIFVPTADRELFDEFIESDTRIKNGSRKISPGNRNKIIGIGESTEITTTDKSQFMLRLLGREYFGNKWYEERMKKDSDSIELI